MSSAENSTMITNDGHGTVTDSDLNMAYLLKEIRQMNEKFKSMEKILREVKSENKQLREQNVAMSNQMKNLTTSVVMLEAHASEIESQTEQTEVQSRFSHGTVNDQINESFEESETDIRKPWNKHEFPFDENVKDQRVQKLSQRFSLRHAENDTTKSDREKPSMLKQWSVNLAEEFPEHATKARRQLFPFIKTSLDNERRASLCYDSLVIDGEVYVYDEEKGKPVPYHK